MKKIVLCAALLSSALQASDALAFGKSRGQPLDPGGEGRIRADSAVPKDQVNRLKQDLVWLQTLRSDATQSEFLSVMGLESSQPEQLQSWLYDRVHYLVNGNFIPSAKTVSPVLGRNFSYPNPGVLPEMELPVIQSPGHSSGYSSGQPLVHAEHEAKIVMANIGSALYLAGKKAGVLLGMSLDGIGNVPLTSPRTGVIMVGEGLFFDGYFGADVPPESTVRSAFRMETFFHEARHSDGNGKSLGFLHALCPAGHDYAGINACDRNLNGPYTVGALMLEHMAANCTDCSEKDRSIMQVLALDNRNRLLSQKDGQPAVSRDAAPEGVFERL